ncbi:CAP domain-containing protein [Streptomyces globosus]|uniref:CAP domain-containing protein n=1 Tax=Streptomyces globosus TaxID=68209 RepID=UPI0038268E3C
MKPNSLATAAALACGLIMLGPAAPAAFGRGEPARGPAAAPVDAVAAVEARGETCPSSDLPPGTGSQISDADAAAIVRAHNDARRAAARKFNPGLTATPVVWDAKVACDAQAWADDPASSAGGRLHHSSRATNGNQGENLLNSSPGPARPLIALDPSVSFSWMAEKPQFDADNNAPVNSGAAAGTNFKAWGHYSQIVWMNPASPTTKVGCGVKEGVPVGSSGATGWILVCRYLEAGNINGQQAIPPGGAPVPPPQQPSTAFSGVRPAMAKQTDNLLTALAVDRDGFLNVAWAAGTQPWHAPVRFGPSVFPPGAPVAMAKQNDNLLTALAVDREGFLNVAWVVGTQPWHAPVRVGPSVFPPGALVAMAKQNDNLLTALAVDREGFLNVAWVVGTQPWHAPVRVGPSVFPPGAPVAMAKQNDNLLTALAVDRDGFLNVAWVAGTQPWHAPVRFGPSVFPPGASVAMAKQQPDLLTALAVDRDGFLNVAWVAGTQPWHAPVRFGPSVFPPGASVAMAKQQPDLLTALAVDRDGFMNVAWVVGTQPWHAPVRFGPSVFPPGAPLAMANQAPDLLTALGVDKQGFLNVAWVVGTQPWHDPVRFGPAVFPASP